MNDELEDFVIDDEAAQPSDDAAEDRRRALRAERGVLRRQDLRRTRTCCWVACLALLGAAVKLAALAWRGWRSGSSASLAVFGGLLVLSLAGAALLARRARASGAAPARG